MTPHLVVVGAGSSGLAAAKLAARWTNAEVTLINASDRFVERVRLHQLATGQRLRDLPITQLLKGTGVQLVVACVTEVDAATRTLRLAGAPRAVCYDLLIYALGSQADQDSVPGVTQHADTVATLEQASRLRQRVGESQIVAVAGGGLTGIEAAAELAEAYPQLTVWLVTGGVLGGGGHVGADTVVWTAGFRVPPLAREAGFAADHRGRMIVDQTLRSVSHPEVYGSGTRQPSAGRTGRSCAWRAPPGHRPRSRPGPCSKPFKQRSIP
jgi:NADH:ubiquinone reductase (H+-translocating)